MIIATGSDRHGMDMRLMEEEGRWFIEIENEYGHTVNQPFATEADARDAFAESVA